MSLKTVSTVEISGNTFAAKDDIKRLGGRWNADRKVWIINIASHPMNTMRERGNLQSALRDLAKKGCKVVEC